MSPKKRNVHTVRVKDVRCINDIEIQLVPGGNRFTGRNGAGKSTLVESALAAGGDKRALDFLAPRDGARKGRIQAFGVNLVIGGRTSKEGQPSIELGDRGRFGDLIRPTAATRETRAKSRIKALLNFHHLPVDEETLLRLCEGDTTVAAAVQANPHWEELSLLDLAEKVRVAANTQALDQERLGAEKKGELATLTLDRDGEGEWDLEGGDVAALTEAVEKKRFEVARLRVEAQGRAALLEQQNEIRASLGEKPDLDDLQWQVDEAFEEVEDLKEKLAAASERLALRRQSLSEARERDEAWSRRAEILSRPITGPSQDEVDAAVVELSTLIEALDNAKACEEESRRRERVRIVRREREDAEERAVAYRAIAQSVSHQVSRLLAEQDLPGLTLEDGELAVVLPSGETRKIEDLSFGEQVKAAVRIVLTAYRDANAPVVVAMEPEHWAALDDENKAETLEIVEREGVYLLIEEPTAGALEVQHVTAADLSAINGVVA